jgi:hypothetical protein
MLSAKPKARFRSLLKHAKRKAGIDKMVAPTMHLMSIRANRAIKTELFEAVEKMKNRPKQEIKQHGTAR